MRRWSLGIGVPVLLVGLFVGYWFYLESQLRRFVDDWIADRRAEGYQVTHGAIVTGGFPLSVYAHIPGPSITLQAGEEMFAWQAEALRISFPPWDFLTYDLESPGQHLIAAVGRDSIGQWSVEAQRARLRWGIESGGGATVGLAFGNVRVRDMLGQAFTLGGLDAELAIAGEEAPASEPRLRLRGEIAKLGLPAELAAPFAPEIERLKTEVLLQSPVMPANLPILFLVLRDYDGRILVRDTELAWGDLQLAGEAELRVDGANYLAGRVPLRVSGHQETIERLLSAGFINELEAVGIATVAGSMAQSDGDGPATLSLEVELVDGVVKVRGVTVLEMEPMPVAGAES